MVFQSYALFPHHDGRATTSPSASKSMASRARIRERVAELLALMQLPGMARALSGAAVAAASSSASRWPARVAIAPRVLLMDEPLGALDLKLREAMQAEIRRIQATLGITTRLRDARPGRGDAHVATASP